MDKFGIHLQDLTSSEGYVNPQQVGATGCLQPVDFVRALERGDVSTVVKCLEQENVNRVLQEDGRTALHIAASRGHVEVARVLLEHGAMLSSPIDTEADTPVHCAASEGHVEMLKLMIAKDPACLTYEGVENATPLHMAAAYGQVEVVKYILSTPMVDKAYVNKRDTDDTTALQWAALYPAVERSVEVAKLLCKHGADVNPTTNWQSPFNMAVLWGNPNLAIFLLKKGAKIDLQSFKAVIDQGYESVARAVIESDQWLVALRGTYYRGARETTPFRELIETMPDVAEMVLDRCIVAGNTRNRDANSDESARSFSVLYYYEFIEDFELAQNSRQQLVHGTVEHSFEAQEHNIESQEQSSNKDSGTLNYQEIKSEQKPPHSNWPETVSTFTKANHPLQIMAKKGRSNLLTHPVILSLIHSKWGVKGRLCFLFNLLTYVAYLIFLTTFALIVPNPLSLSCCCANVSDINITFLASINITGLCSNHSVDGDTMNQLTTASIIAVSVVVLLCAFIRLFLELLQLFQSTARSVQFWIAYASQSRPNSHTDKHETLTEFLAKCIPEYLYDLENWVELAHYSCSIAFVLSVLTADGFCVSSERWQVGISALFLGWFVFVLFTSKIPVIGIYVIILLKISWTVVKLLILAAMLVVAFGLAFFMTFTDFSTIRSPFSDAGRSLLKTMTMTIGEVDFNAIFRLDPSGGSDDLPEIPYPPISYVLWIVFILLMPVILINMLTGLAVGDTNEVLQHAHLRRLSLQIDLVLTIEELQITFDKWLPNFFKRSQVVYKDIYTTTTPNVPSRALNKWVKELDTQLWAAGLKRYDRSNIFNTILATLKDESLCWESDEKEETTVQDVKTGPLKAETGMLQRIEEIERDVRDMKTILQDISSALKAGPSQLGQSIQ